MPMNRVQFQPGLSMSEFMDRSGSEEQCEAALIAARWPRGFRCPACGGAPRTSFCREGRLYWQCAACLHQCSVTDDAYLGNGPRPARPAESRSNHMRLP